MHKMVAHLNIEHFQQLLTTETDEAKRAMIRQLLAEETEKLRVAEAKLPTAKAARDSA